MSKIFKTYDEICKEIIRICNFYKVKAIIFGSYAHKTNDKNSDIDIALKGETLNILDAEEALLEMPCTIPFDILHFTENLKEGNEKLYNEIKYYGLELN